MKNFKSFKSFNIEPEPTTFIGDKIKIQKVLDKEIIIHKYKIGDSKVKQGTKMMTLQIEKDNEKHVIFTGSRILMEMIERVPKDGFPFKTKIVKEFEHLEFT